METSVNTQSATPESVWAFLREIAAQNAETDLILRESRKETDRQIKANEKFMKNLGIRLGGMGNTCALHEVRSSHGSFAEEYFFK